MKRDCIGDDIIIVDDAVPDATFHCVKSEMERDDLGWTYLANSAYASKLAPRTDESDQFSFGYTCDRDSFTYGVCLQAFLSTFSKVDLQWPQSVLRIRAGMHVSATTKVTNTPHVDMTTSRPDGLVQVVPCITALLYLNDSDGETILYDKRCSEDEDIRSFVSADMTSIKQMKIECKENRIVFFNGDRLHCSTRQTTPTRRIVLNYNYI